MTYLYRAYGDDGRLLYVGVAETSKPDSGNTKTTAEHGLTISTK